MWLTVHRIPFSTNVERIALAAGHKGIAHVWKVPPNRLADEPHAPDRNALAAELRGSLDRFEALLDGRAQLLGDDFGIADVIAFPCLKYAIGIAPDDPDAFHHVLAEHLALGTGFPRLRDWIARCDRRPRA